VSSHLLDVLKEVHEQVTGNAPEVGAVHAGLECGIIGEKYPGMDMISFGPQIEFPHSPDERVKVDSVGVFYQLLTRTLERLTR
jgi:dipeptidase D